MGNEVDGRATLSTSVVRVRLVECCGPAATDGVRSDEQSRAWTSDRPGPIRRRSDLSRVYRAVAAVSSPFADDRAEALTGRNGSPPSAEICSGRTYRQEVGGSIPPAPTSVRGCSESSSRRRAGARRAHFARIVARRLARLSRGGRRPVSWFGSHDRRIARPGSRTRHAAGAYRGVRSFGVDRNYLGRRSGVEPR